MTIFCLYLHVYVLGLSLIFNDCEPQDLNANYRLQPPEFMSIPSETFAEQLTFVDAVRLLHIPNFILGLYLKHIGSDKSCSIFFYKISLGFVS